MYVSNLVKSVLHLSLFRVFTGLLEQKIAILGEKFWRFVGLGGQPGHGVVDELAAGFVEGGYKVAVVEGGEDQCVVLLVDLQRAGHVQLGLVQGFRPELLNGGQVPGCECGFRGDSSTLRGRQECVRRAGTIVRDIRFYWRSTDSGTISGKSRGGFYQHFVASCQ